MTSRCVLRVCCARLCRMASDGSALVLYGLTLSGDTAWQELIPLLSDHHQVYAPTALGHRGGPAVQRRPVTMAAMVAAAEHYLDQHGLGRPHLAGNSVGGYIAIELARRGRAASVCALSPAGFWSAGDGLQTEVCKVVHKNVANARRSRPLAPLLFKSATVRRLGMRDAMCHGDRLSAARIVAIADDGIASTVVADDLLGSEWQIQPLNPCRAPSLSHGLRKTRSFP